MPSQEEQMHSPAESQSAPTKKQGGSNKLFVILIAVVVLIAGAFMAMRFGLIAAPGWLARTLPPQMAPMLSDFAGLDSEQAKLAFMLETGQSGVCTMTDTESAEDVVYYIKDDMFKIEMTVLDESTGETFESYVLNDGEYQYTWSTLEDQGIKYRVPSEEEMEEIDESIAEMQETDFDWTDDIEFDEEEDDRYDVSCQLRNVPDSEFVPPQDIEFTDFTDGFGEPFGFEDSDLETPEFDDDFDAGDFEMPDTDDLESLEDWAQEMEERYQDTE